MPAYNQRDYVSEALDSLLAQTYGRWEAIVVDDGSPDDVAEVVGAYVKKDPRIKFFHTENHGLPGARNFAVTQANGEFLLPLDAKGAGSEDGVFGKMYRRVRCPS